MLHEAQRKGSPTAPGNGDCQRRQRPMNPAARNCNAGRQFGAGTGLADHSLLVFDGTKYNSKNVFVGICGNSPS